ncbi:hypothetical protein PAXRUDRAFT_836275 [Paxillus rubicundulus Ve08.2h10]|uniref:Uncharacterized protein n=1 Tax=Paxillus rubicundulus Ve08.2h10 TaxID=930991 RepID=A0A0D0D0G1_9AGAM|nr:hypothetical protein PAXRUDRAFT_836275 [Paxillus rubicundulus Ve08.2h10]
MSYGIKPTRGKPATQQLLLPSIKPLLSMQFLTLLASTASLSAYTLVGVHAQPGCTNCPAVVNGVPLYDMCIDSKAKTTYCNFGLVHLKWVYCHYNEHGDLTAASKGASCPSPMRLNHSCQACT